MLAIGRRGVNRCRLYRGEWLRDAPQATNWAAASREVGEQRRDFEAPQRRLECEDASVRRESRPLRIPTRLLALVPAPFEVCGFLASVKPVR